MSAAVSAATGRAEPDDPALVSAVVGHAARGVRLQLGLRAVLVGFVVVTLAVVPPEQGAPVCIAVAVVYALGAAAFTWWAMRGGPVVVRWAWLGLLVDLAVLGTLTLVTGVAAQESWTADILVNGCFLLPVLATTQLRPGVCAAVVVPTVVVYLATSVATQEANDEPWAAIAFRTIVLAGVGVGAIALSRIQRSRVASIADLLRDRTALLADLVDLSERERRTLSEQLHDGALQYVLAARQELEDVSASADPTTVARIDEALNESCRLLRSTVSELHPMVLERAGLARALEDLARVQRRPGREVEVDATRWPAELRSSADGVLYGVARELVANAVKHAGASQVLVTLALDGGTARLEVADDGRGLQPGDRDRALAGGHIGLHSQQLRVEAAGGTLTFDARQPRGTRARVELPAVAASEAVVTAGHVTSPIT